MSPAPAGPPRQPLAIAGTARPLRPSGQGEEFAPDGAFPEGGLDGAHSAHRVHAQRLVGASRVLEGEDSLLLGAARQELLTQNAREQAGADLGREHAVPDALRDVIEGPLRQFAAR
jgi:hypothetical protein